MGPKRAINDPKWVQGLLWKYFQEGEIEHVGGRSARGQKELREIQGRAAEMFLGCPAQKVEIEQWLELALGEPPEYKNASTSNESCKQIEQEYATHYTRCLWDLRPPNPAAFETKLRDLRNYHNGFKRSTGLQRLKEKRLELKKKSDLRSRPGEPLDPENSAPHGKEMALESGAAHGAHFEQLFVAEAETVQPGLRESSGRNAERHTSPAAMGLQSEVVTSSPIGECPSSGKPTPALSTKLTPGSRPAVMFDLFEDDKSLTEPSSDESIASKPSPKKAKLGDRPRSENDEPPRPLRASTGVANDSRVKRMSPNKSIPVEPFPNRPKFSYGSESEIDEPSSPMLAPTRVIDSGSFSRGPTASKPKRKLRKAQSRIATQLPVGFQQTRRSTRSSNSSEGPNSLSPTTVPDAPGDRTVLQLPTSEVDSNVPAAPEARELDFHDAQALTKQLPSLLVESLPTTGTRKKAKRKRTDSLAAASLGTTAFDRPGETTKVASGKRSSRSNGAIQNPPSRFSTRDRHAQSTNLSVYAEIALEEKRRRSKKARKSYQRSVTATQDAQTSTDVPNLPSIDGVQPRTSPSPILSLPSPLTDTSSSAAGVPPEEECTRFLKEQPSALTISAENTDGSSAPPNRKTRDYNGNNTPTLNPTMDGVAAGPSTDRRGSPAIGGTEILSSPPVGQPRRKKRKREHFKPTASMQEQQQAPQQGAPVDAVTPTAEAAPSVLDLDSRPQGDAQALLQTINDNHEPVKVRVKPRKGKRKGQSAIATSRTNPPELTPLPSEQTSVFTELLNYSHETSQNQATECRNLEGAYNAGPSRLLTEPVIASSTTDPLLETDIRSLQSAQVSGDGTGEDEIQEGAASQPQDPQLPPSPPQIDPEVSSRTEHQDPSVPPEAPPGTRPLASIVADEVLTVQYPRPRLPAKPQVWCMTRQELCEGTTYFRSYQGGVYANGGLVRGYMLDGYGAPRDICAYYGKLIISHAGGSSHQVTRVGSNGRKITNTELRRDQEVNNGYARYLYANWKLGKPVVLVVGKNYPLFPFDIEGRSYVILGWYRVIQMWTELEPLPDTGKLFKRLKVAFQWISDQGPPFFDQPGGYLHAAPDNPSPTEPSLNERATRDSSDDQVCKESVASRRSRTWKRTSAKPLDPAGSRTVCSQGPDARSTSQDATFTCHHCHSTSPLVYEGSWMCLQGDCPLLWKLADGTFPTLDSLTYSTSFLRLREQTTTSGLLPYSIVPGALPDPGDYGDLVTGKPFTKAMHCTMCGRLSCRVYLTKWVCAGCGASMPISFATTKRNLAPQLTHLYLKYEISGGMINAQVCFVHDPVFGMVTAMRYILADNCGVIWHLQATPNTRRQADHLLDDFQVVEHFQRERLSCTKTTTTMLGSQFVMNSGMPYHYVSEATTVSLEDSPPCVAQALELINHKAALVQDPSLDEMPFNEALSICYLEGQRMNYHSDAEPGLGDVVASLSLGNPASMDFRLYSGAWRGTRELSIELRHGDVIIMQGRRIQELYQHKVTPIGLRVGITARQIYPHHLKPRERQEILSTRIEASSEGSRSTSAGTPASTD